MTDTPTKITVGVFFSTVTAFAALIFTAFTFFYTEIRENRERFETQLDDAKATYRESHMKTMADIAVLKSDFVQWHTHFHAETDKEFKRFADALEKFLQMHGEQFQSRPED